MTLRLAEDLELPEEAVTQTFGILGKRGVGKTYTASVLGEEMLGIGGQLVVLDPLDAWWGLRIGADGKDDGLQILVLGGKHGDLPLDPLSGAIVADLVIEHRLSVVLSLRHMSKGDQRRFVTDFCERLYHRKGEDEHRTPLHVAIDEADAFAPQRVFAGQERMVGSIDDLVRRGRSSGIGVSLITQRAASINKDVLTQIEVLVVHKTISPQDRKALEAWVEAHDVHGQRQEFMASLASLPIGTAWFWSPGWLEIFQKVRIRRRNTYDSSATPKVGQQAPAPRQLPPVDLEHLRGLLAATLEKVKSEDPKVLQAQIAELRRQLADRPKEVTIERVEVPILPEDYLDHVERLEGLRDQLEEVISGMRRRLNLQLNSPPAVRWPVAAESTAAMPPDPRDRPRPGSATETSPPPSAAGVTLKAGQRAMLAVLARLAGIKVTRVQLATLAGLAPSGGTFSTYFSHLKREGLISETNGLVTLTEAGWAMVDPRSDLEAVTSQSLVTLWASTLKAGARRMLEVLVGAYPMWLTREELAQSSEIAQSGGTFTTYLSKLRANGLIQEDSGVLRASPTLFLGEPKE